MFMQTILYNYCGMDVHKDSVVACILKTRDDSTTNFNEDDVEKEIRVFEIFIDNLAQLREWLESENCCHAAMESTGVYWHPVYDAFEHACCGKMEIIVTNPCHRLSLSYPLNFKKT